MMRSYRNEFSEWNRVMDSVFSDFFNVGNEIVSLLEPMKKLPSIVASANWPPFDAYVGSDKSYNVEIAAAGYKQDQISVDFKDDNVVVSFLNDATPDAEKATEVADAVQKMDSEPSHDKRFLHRGIKRPNEHTVSYFIDPQYFDKDKITANFKDGILHIKVEAGSEPVKDEKKIAINAA
jgi:HSP20 family molecular chaperone IbpA